jgi:hypothetical protein
LGALAGAFVVVVALLEPAAAAGFCSGASAAEARTNDTITPRANTVASSGLRIGVVRSAGAMPIEVSALARRRKLSEGQRAPQQSGNRPETHCSSF